MNNINGGSRVGTSQDSPEHIFNVSNINIIINHCNITTSVVGNSTGIGSMTYLKVVKPLFPGCQCFAVREPSFGLPSVCNDFDGPGLGV